MTFIAYEEFKAPWEKEGEELDPEKVKRLVYNLQKSEDDSKESLKSKDAKIAEADKALEIYREAEKAAAREKETAEQKAAREATEREAAATKVQNDLARENMLLKVQIEKDLTEAEIGRLKGETLEELLADADEFIKLVPRQAEEEPELDEDGNPKTDQAGNPLVRVPKVRVPVGGGGDNDDDVDVVKHVREHQVHPLLA